MFRLKILFLCVCLTAGAPSKERTYEHSTRGVRIDTFRPKFPGVDYRKDASDGGELLLFKMVSFPDSQTASNTPVASDVELDAINTRSVSPKKNEYHGDDENTHIKSEESDVARDIIEKPVVEKTIIRECNCDKHIEEKHLDEPFEIASADNTPEESQYQISVSPDKLNTGDNSQKDMYDVPVNPDFGLPPSEGSEDNVSKKDLYDVPINPDFGLVPSDEQKTSQEKLNPGKDDLPTYDADTNSEEGTVKKDPNHETDNLKPAVPEAKPVDEETEPIPPVQGDDTAEIAPKTNDPETNVDPNIDAPVSLPDDHKQPDPVSYPQHPVDGPKIPIEAVPSGPKTKVPSEPIPHAQDDDTAKTAPMTNDPETNVDPNIDAQYPKAPVSLPDDHKEPDPVSYPQHPVDGPKIPIEAVPSGPKTEAPFVEENVPDVSQDPIGVDVDIKPDVIEPIDGGSLKPIENDGGSVKPIEVPVGIDKSPSHPEKKPLPPTVGAVCEDMGLRKFIYLLNKAGYKDMLTRKRPITIFVPSDEAWSHLPASVLYRLQRDRNFLRRVLRYHMVDGLESGQIRKDYYCPSMQPGAGYFINTFGKNMYVNGVPALPSPVKPSNGAVYTLSRVMYPLPANNLAEAIQTTGTFTRFYTLAAEAGILDRELSERGPYTLFAPTDEAFRKLPFKTIEWLSWDKEAVRELLLKHLVPGTHYSTFVPESEEGHLSSLNGADIEFKPTDEIGEFSVNGAHLCAHDITARNGVLHAVDEVLFSKDLKPRPFVRPPLKSIYG